MDENLFGDETYDEDCGMRAMKYYLKYTQINAKKFSTLEAEQPNILLALSSAYDTWQHTPSDLELAELFIDSVSQLAGFLGNRGDLQGRVAWGKKALEVAKKIGHISSVAEVCASVIAWPLLQLGDYEQAKKYCEQGMQAALQCQELKWAGRAARSLSGIARDQSQAIDAEYWAKQAFRFSQQSRDMDLKKGALLDLGYAALLNHEYIGAEKRFRILAKLAEENLDKEKLANRSLDLAKEILANRSFDVGLAILNQGRVDEARKLYEKGFALAEELKSKVAIGEAEFGLAKVAEASGDLERAKELNSSARHRFDLVGVTRLGRAEQFVEFRS